MNNEELKKKIVDILQLKLQECPLQPHGIMYRDAAEYIADALITAGYGDVKTVREIGASAAAMAVFEAAKAEHRAEVAERAFSKLVHEMYEHGIRPMCDEKFFVESRLKDAEKELVEEGKDEQMR